MAPRPSARATSDRPFTFPNGETVQDAMRRMGLNAHQLALRIHVSPQTACRWRDGARPLEVYQAVLANALQVPLTAPSGAQS